MLKNLQKKDSCHVGQSLLDIEVFLKTGFTVSTRFLEDSVWPSEKHYDRPVVGDG